jgi:restriction system protein
VAPVAEITRRRSGELLQGVLTVLHPCTEGMRVAELLSAMEKLVPPTPFEASDYPNRPGVRRYEKIIRFMTINAVKAGWLIKSRGTWTITDQGRRALEAFPDAEQLMRESIRLYRAWQQDQPIETTFHPTAVIADEEATSSSVTLEEAEEAAWQEIERHLEAIEPYDFQNLVAGLLRAMNYHVAWVSPPGPDRGLDILAYTDPLGATGPRIKVQVKRLTAKKVDVDGVRSFMATLGTQDVGIFISLGGFTREAEREARSQENRRLTLIEAEQLFGLWIEHYDKLHENEKQLLPLRPVHYLALPD